MLLIITPSLLTLIQLKHIPPSDIDHPNILLSLNISEDEVLNVLLNLDATKAMEPDGIPPIVLQRCPPALYQPLCCLFNLTLQFSYLPSD